MKRLYSLIILFGWFGYASAQIITGFVHDGATKQPIPGVNVYLDGTSIGTVTDASGRFELKAKSVINTRLMLSHVAYYTVVINRPFEGIPDIVYLKERVNELKEVSILADRFSREQKMQAFRYFFLGATKAGKACSIQNEDDIEISFNMQTRTLSASSDKPIVVVNNYLGYRVLFEMVDFKVKYYDRDTEFTSLEPFLSPVQKISFFFFSSFTDLSPENKKVKQRRDEVYKGASNYFFKSFINSTLQNNGFKISIGNFLIDSQKFFTMKDTLSQKMISIIPERKMSYEEDGLEDVFLKINVRDNNSNKTSIFFLTDSLLVDRYGNISCPDKIMFTGVMDKRAGEMLPEEYELQK